MARRNLQAIARLLRGVLREFWQGRLPSWMVARVEAKALRKREQIALAAARRREIDGKAR
jgi:hypothetical protein